MKQTLSARGAQGAPEGCRARCSSFCRQAAVRGTNDFELGLSVGVCGETSSCIKPSLSSGNPGMTTNKVTYPES